MTRLPRFTRSEIKVFLTTAKRVLRVPGFDFLLAPATAQGRLLVITPRRIGTAPQRNTVRRRLKALFFRMKLAQQGYDCGVIVKKAGTTLPSDELEKLLLKAFNKISYAPSKNIPNS